MTPAEWEHCLTHHYLRSDGPLGGTPLTFVDATPAELASAAREDGLTEEGAQRAFLSLFDRWTVQAWLDGQRDPPVFDGDVPGYFRYLVLAALVSATEEGVGATHNFRIRLGELLGGGPLHSVSGVNRLWKAVVGWCDRRRAAGHPIRRVILPSAGSMTLIGHAVRIAFPSWRDRSAFTRVLRPIPSEMRQVPERLVQELSRPQQRVRIPAAVLGALEDFEGALRRNHRMLLGHRFWTLVQSIDTRLGEEQGGGGPARWTLEGRFSGYEQDVLELKLIKGVGLSQSVTPVFRGGLQALEEITAAELPFGLARAMAHGVLFLSEGPAASWVADESGPRDDAAALLVARSGSIALTWPLDTTWTHLEGCWSVSRRLDPLSVVGLRQVLGLGRIGLARLVDLSLEGGVKTARSVWLGRPGVLPQVSASSGSQLAVLPLTGAEGVLTVSGGPPRWALEATDPLTGRWLLTASEGTTETEKVLTLEADAPERWDWSMEEDWNFEREEELVYQGDRPAAAHSYLELQAGEEPESALDDILEAIYAGAGSGWAESDLLTILEPLLPSSHFVWDFLRGLAEAGWLQPYVSRRWRARKWRLCAPSICVLGPEVALIEGSVGTSARRRLIRFVNALGGRFMVRPGVSSWAPPSLIVNGLEVHELAKALSWPCVVPAVPAFVAAPHCWPDEKRTSDARRLAGVWSFELGFFIEPESRRERNEGNVELQRLVRERADDRDLYRVTHGSEQFLTSSRTVAILEAYRRRKTPLFRWAGGRFYRTTRGGHLPLRVAKALRRRSLSGSGPVPKPVGVPGYEYAADVSGARWLAAAFGPALAGISIVQESDLLRRIVSARRAGSRTSWYAAPERMGP